MDTLYIVIPAYNEEENIESVIKQWYPVLQGKSDKSRIVVADSGSNDNTHNILIRLMNSEYPQLELLSDTEKFHGPKVIALYDYAIKNCADYVFQTDSDGQTDPSEFEQFWYMRNEYDGIFGNRVIRGDGKDRAFVENVVCLLLRLYFGVKIPDANAPFRLLNVDVLKKYLYRLPSKYNIPNIMITTYFVKYNESYMFKEISFKPRQGGHNSINIPKIVGIGWQSLRDFSAFKKNM